MFTSRLTMLHLLCESTWLNNFQFTASHTHNNTGTPLNAVSISVADSCFDGLKYNYLARNMRAFFTPS